MKDKLKISVMWMENNEEKETSTAFIRLEHEND